jgi:hypothetical protein
MTIHPTHWLEQQTLQQRQLLLIIDTVSAPDVIATLFKLAPIRDYIRLFQGTEFEDLLEHSPWLIRVESSSLKAATHLLQHPELNWGWAASAANLDLNEVAQHWRERMVFRENDQRWFYRFQDNRVIAQHLSALSQAEIPLLLGPLCDALCWNGEHWQRFESEQPALYPEPFATPWLQVPLPAEVADNIERSALIAWLWGQHGDATQMIAETQPLEPWLTRQTQRARDWNWHAPEQMFFLLEHQLDPNLVEHSAWEPRTHETPQEHYARCTRELFALKNGGRT